MQAGWDTRPPAVLAGFDKPPNQFETDLYLAAILRSPGLEMPGEDELSRIVALIIAGDMVSGAASPDAGCSQLGRLAAAAGYPPWLMALDNAADAHSLAEVGILGKVEEVIRHILDASRQRLDGQPPRW